MGSLHLITLGLRLRCKQGSWAGPPNSIMAAFRVIQTNGLRSLGMMISIHGAPLDTISSEPTFQRLWCPLLAFYKWWRRKNALVAGKTTSVRKMAGIVVVFDFDRTIIDGDSDNWVVTKMGLTNLFHELRHNMSWNSLMDRMMKELHSKGKTTDEIAECLKCAPIHPRIVAAIKSAYALGCDLRIVSDANQFFIEAILKHHGLLSCFSEINTNPTFVDEEGRLRISPYHDFTSSPHGCNLCPSNMCKGLVIERIRASTSENGKKRFIYLGDGNGDFCPSLKLEEGDHVMPRKNFPLWERIRINPLLIKAEVHAWSDGEEVERILLHLINTISVQENISSSSASQLNSSDCKFQTSPGSTHEAFPQTLPVPH